MIRFHVNKRWTEKNVAIRMAQIVRGEGSVEDSDPPWNRDGKWQLDRGNDWFLTKINDTEYELRYRYMTDDIQCMLSALEPFLSQITFT